MSVFRKANDQTETDRRLTRAEQIARDHARRLKRLELEVGIIRPNPMRKERPS
jgi:hypothetical protein